MGIDRYKVKTRGISHFKSLVNIKTDSRISSINLVLRE